MGYNDNLSQPQFKEWIGQTVGKEAATAEGKLEAAKCDLKFENDREVSECWITGHKL